MDEKNMTNRSDEKTKAVSKKKLVWVFMFVLLVAVIVAVVVFWFCKNSNPKVAVNSEKFERISDKILILDEFAHSVNDTSSIDFGEYDELEKMALLDYNAEVWIVCLENVNQQEDIYRLFRNRLERLKKYIDLTTLENAVIKQEDGYAIMIVAENANAIEEVISNELKKDNLANK